MDAQTWKAVQKKGLCSGITSPEIYEARVLSGLKEAASWVLMGKEKPPTLTTAKTIHRLAFGECAPFAGKPTKIQLITRGFPTCEPGRIETEFDLLNEQFRDGVPKNANPQERCRWTAFACARWLRIHPFPDGNKRTIALWAVCHLQNHLGPLSQDTNLHRQIRSTWKSLREGNLAPTGELMLAATGHTYPPGTELDWSSPHKIAPTFTEIQIH